MSDIPTLETARLRLTALTEKHFNDYAAMLSDPESTRWIGDGQPLDRTNAWRSLAMLLGHWQLRDCGMWALELKATGEFIGRAGLMYPDGWPDLELGWMLKPGHRHHAMPLKPARPCSTLRGNSCMRRVSSAWCGSATKPPTGWPNALAASISKTWIFTAATTMFSRTTRHVP